MTSTRTGITPSYPDHHDSSTNLATGPKQGGPDVEPGSATWYRQADWFNNANGYRPEGHVVLPFSTTTIERGLKAMRDRGYISADRKKKGPDGRRFQHPRLIYTNRFNASGNTATVIDIATRTRLA
jgi:hypothetical protein